MQHLRTEAAALETGFYVLCAIAAAVMVQTNFRAGHPPFVFWFLVFLCIVGVARIFMIAWREDRRSK